MASNKKALNGAEGKLIQSDLVETLTHGRLGLRCIIRVKWKKTLVDLRRELVQSEVRQQALKRKEAGSDGRTPGARS